MLVLTYGGTWANMNKRRQIGQKLQLIVSMSNREMEYPLLLSLLYKLKPNCIQTHIDNSALFKKKTLN